MPGENELKISALENMLKNSKATTSPVSIRVKDSTLAVLNIYATKYDMKVGTIINQILDSYADAYNAEMTKKYGKINNEMFQYLNGVAKEIEGLSDVELAKKFIEEIEEAKYLPTTTPEYLVEELNAIESVDLLEPYLIQVGYTNIIADGEGGCRKGMTCATINGRSIDLSGVFVDSKKWLTTTYMFYKYYEKRSEQLKRKYLGADALVYCDDVVKNANSQSKLVFGLAETLANFIEPEERKFDDIYKEVIED